MTSATPCSSGVVSAVTPSSGLSPVSDARARKRLGAAGGAVSMVTARTPALTLPAASAEVAVRSCGPSVRVAVVKDQSPAPSAVTVASRLFPS